MSRTVWFAVGAIGAALFVTAGGAEATVRAAPLLVPALLLVAIAGARIPLVAPAGGAALGALVIAVRIVAIALPAPLTSIPEGDGPWAARVETVSSPRDGHQRATLLLLTEPPVRVAFDGPPYPRIQPADRILVEGALRPPPDDDYGAYLRRSGVDATLRSRTLEVRPDDGDPIRAVEALRRGAGDALALALPEPEAGLSAGILIGLRDRVDRDLAATFTAAGVSHVVAISGWNIAIVALLVDRLLAAAPRRRRRLVTLAAIAIYTVLTGASASVLRAAAMAIAVTLARETGRAGTALHALALAVTGMLVLDPAVIADAGFQLSALATAGLVAWATPLTGWLRGRAGGRLPEWLCIGLGVSLAAQIATLPVVLLSFGRLAALSPLLNLVVVPLVPLAMAGGALALAVGALGLVGLPASVVTLLALPGWLPLGALTGIVRFGASLPLASVTLDPPANVVAAAVIPVAIVLRRVRPWERARSRAAPTRPAIPPPRADRRPGQESIRRPLPRAALAVLVIAVATAGLLVLHRPDGRLHIVALDVGQGDAILVEGPRGSRLLVDGGPDPARLVTALDGRLAPWDRRINILLLTHPHEDHVAGLPLLLERYRIGRALDVGMRGRGPGFAAWEIALAIRNVARGRLATGDTLTLDGIRFTVLWPDAATVPAESPDQGTAVNNVSVVLLGEYGRQRVLLMGDVEEAIDPILLRRGLPRADVLKVAHHGSRTSSTEAFLEAVRPRVAVISAGQGNPYGHPTPATLARLASAGAQVARTDANGTVEVVLDGRQAELHVERRATAGDGGTPLQLVTAGIGCPIPPRAPPAPAPGARADEPLGYDRGHVRARPSRGGTSPPLTEPACLVPSPRAGSSRGRGVARGPRRLATPRCPCAPRGSRRPAARRRQAARSRGPRPPPPRRCRCPMVRPEPTMTTKSGASAAPIAYFWGDDAYGLERAAARVGERVAADGEPLDVWRVRGDQTTPPEIAERVGTAPMFSGGTLVIVTDPYPLVRAEEGRDALLPIVADVAPGNALVFLEPVDGNRAMASLKVLRDAVAAAGGEVVQVQAPKEGGMTGWIQREATDRRIRLGPAAAQELAKRIGAFVSEGDVDRRRQSHLAIGELEKLALYRLGETVTAEDVAALVPEAVPGSIWAFLDAVGERNTRIATELLERLLPVTPPPVLVTVLHRRIRDLIVAGDLAGSGARPPDLMKALNSKSEWAINKLVRQARGWSPVELEAALEGVLELDAATKGRDDRALTDSQLRLTFLLWLMDYVRRGTPPAAGGRRSP